MVFATFNIYIVAFFCAIVVVFRMMVKKGQKNKAFFFCQTGLQINSNQVFVERINSMKTIVKRARHLVFKRENANT